MTGRAAVPLLLLAAALAATVAWELQPQDADAPPLPAAAPAAPSRAASPVPGARVGEGTAMLLARPLFSPDRRPPAPGAVAAAQPDAPLPRLTGTLVTPEGRSAIFAGAPQPIVVREGGILGRFSVQRIEPGRVTLAGPGGVQVVGTEFDPAAPRPRPAAPPPSLGIAPLAAGGPPPPIPGTSPGPADAPQDAMPFESLPAPSGMDIIREQARRQTPGAGPAR